MLRFVNTQTTKLYIFMFFLLCFYTDLNWSSHDHASVPNDLDSSNASASLHEYALAGQSSSPTYYIKHVLSTWVQVIHEYPACLFSSSPDETRIAECRSVHAKIVQEWEGRADKHNTCTDLCSDVETSRKWFGEHWVVFMRFSLFRSCTHVAHPRGPTDQEY
jgi:hypothetical protein